MQKQAINRLFTSVNTDGRRGMWRRRHGRWVGLTLIVCVGFGGGGTATGQDSALDAPFVDAAHGRAVHRIVAGWAERGAVGGQRPAPVRVHRAAGVRVTLRTRGHLLGYGDAWRDDLDAFLANPDPLDADADAPPPEPINLVVLAERAAFAAFAATDRRLRDAAADAAFMARIRPELQGAAHVPTIRELFNLLTVDVQIAHTPRPISLALSEPKDAALDRFVPGYHGLLADGPGDADQDDAWLYVWPGSALSHNTEPIGYLRQLAKGRPDVAFHETDRFGRAGGPRLWRFENIHVVRPRPGLPVSVLIRGGATLPRAALDQASLEERSQRVAAFLVDRFIGQGSVRGPYLPSADRFDPSVATLREASLAAFALAQHRATQERLKAVDPIEPRVASRVDDLLVRVVSDLDTPEVPLVLAPDESALLLLTRVTLRPPTPAGVGPAEDPDALHPGGDPIARRLAADLRSKLGPDGERGVVLRAPPRPDEPDASPRRASRAAAAIAALALGRYGVLHGDADALADADAVTDALWAGNAAGDGNALPWLAWAHLTLSRPWRDAGLLTDADAADRRAAVDATLDRLQDFQIVAPPPGVPADILGGFDLPPAPPPAAPRPDWRTAPLLLALGTAMAFDEDAGPEARGDLGRLLTAQAAARFLAQLMLDPSDAYYVRAPELALGGVRPALDDNRLSLTPSAMTLLAFDRLRLTLDERAAER
ncbi:MAG: hypothetical protein AAGE65_01360 [Planctomycetota bacterium]